jgi:hypothetical protein
MLTTLSGTFMTASRMDGFSYAEGGFLTGSALARAFRRLFGTA